MFSLQRLIYQSIKKEEEEEDLAVNQTKKKEKKSKECFKVLCEYQGVAST